MNDEQLQKLVDRLLNLEPIPDSPACPKCAAFHERLDALLVKQLSELVKEQAGKIMEQADKLIKLSKAISLIEGANATRDLLLDLIERRQQGMPPTWAQVINRAVLAECREIGATPRLSAEGEIEYPVKALDKVLSTYTDRNALHKLCKGALMAMAELTDIEDEPLN